MQNQFILFLAFIFPFFGSCQTDTKQESNQTVQTANNEKKIKKINHYLIDPETKEKELVSTEFYNKKGQKNKVFTYVEDYTSEERYHYDDKGNEILKEEFNRFGELEKNTKTEYEYSDDNKIIKATESVQRGKNNDFSVHSIAEYSYNDKGQKIKEYYKARWGEMEYEYSYHPNGNEKEKITYAFEGTEKVIRISNEEGKRIKEEIFRRKDINVDFQLDLTNIWKYDGEGNEILHEGLKDGKVVSRRVSDPNKKNTFQEILYY